jgi:hypothetical protein
LAVCGPIPDAPQPAVLSCPAFGLSAFMIADAKVISPLIVGNLF